MSPYITTQMTSGFGVIKRNKIILNVRRNFHGVVLLSNGKVSGESELLGYAKGPIQSMLLSKKIRSAVLVPYAVIRGNYDARAAELENSLGIQVTSLHHLAIR